MPVTDCTIDAGVTANVGFATAASPEVPMTNYDCNLAQLPGLPKAAVVLDWYLYPQVMPGLFMQCRALSCVGFASPGVYADTEAQ
jgi:hypothetical protein